jgi:hypothetical protein
MPNRNRHEGPQRCVRFCLFDTGDEVDHVALKLRAARIFQAKRKSARIEKNTSEQDPGDVFDFTPATIPGWEPIAPKRRLSIGGGA